MSGLHFGTKSTKSLQTGLRRLEEERARREAMDSLVDGEKRNSVAEILLTVLFALVMLAVIAVSAFYARQATERFAAEQHEQEQVLDGSTAGANAVTMEDIEGK